MATVMTREVRGESFDLQNITAETVEWSELSDVTVQIGSVHISQTQQGLLCCSDDLDMQLRDTSGNDTSFPIALDELATPKTGTLRFRPTVPLPFGLSTSQMFVRAQLSTGMGRQYCGGMGRPAYRQIEVAPTVIFFVTRPIDSDSEVALPVSHLHAPLSMI